jgi:hypothetical protein
MALEKEVYMEGFVWIAILILVICIVQSKKPYNEERLERQQEQQYLASRNMICPHCQTKGSVTTRQVKKKVGVSGGKATAGILTCGLSLFAVGLSRKAQITEATCSNCSSIWFY